MGSGRHGAARPPIGVLVQQERVEFSLFTSIIVTALAVMVLIGIGWAGTAFWLAVVPVVIAGVLIVRRISRLARDELGNDELL
ncbi:hypothetical protein [Streptomonospora salina]|uniref:Flp pilus assembly protein TadB n=1 Tax=Streptomonospora salina TaxID=104205 RepID=A0A841E965_9ACTN|nr:hypothetical protein [Streptomonospora salina]MBB5999502.1 Flp pilus assembly protein TadB [Streptomonospora salina]